MKAQGILFLSKGSPILKPDASGRPQLMMRAVARDARSTIAEPWTLFWTGQDAAEFYLQHRAELTPGQPIQVSAHSLRPHGVGYFVEIQAQIEHCALAPRAHAQAHTTQNTEANTKET